MLEGTFKAYLFFVETVQDSGPSRASPPLGRPYPYEDVPNTPRPTEAMPVRLRFLILFLTRMVAYASPKIRKHRLGEWFGRTYNIKPWLVPAAVPYQRHPTKKVGRNTTLVNQAQRTR